MIIVELRRRNFNGHVVIESHNCETREEADKLLATPTVNRFYYTEVDPHDEFLELVRLYGEDSFQP